MTQISNNQSQITNKLQVSNLEFRNNLEFDSWVLGYITGGNL